MNHGETEGKYSVGVSFSNPYSVFLPSSQLDKLSIEENDPAKLEFQNQQENETIIGKVTPMERFETKKETHAIFYALPQMMHFLPEDLRKLFGRFRGTEPESMHLEQLEDIKDYVTTIHQWNESRLQEADILVGCGFFPFLQEQGEELDQLVTTPFFRMGERSLTQLLHEGVPPLRSVTPYNQKIEKPEVIYVCTEEHPPSERQKDQVKAKLTGMNYLMPSKNYLFTLPSFPFHGPVGLDPQGGPTKLVTLTKENIRFCTIHTGQIVAEQPHQPFTFENVQEEVERIVQEGTVSTKRENQRITVSFPPAHLELYVHPKVITYKYSHAITKEHIDALENVLNDLTFHALERRLNVSLSRVPLRFHPLPDAVTRSVWILDTNTLYYQITANKPTSLIHFLLPNPYVYGKCFKVPWQVLCEINKHKEAEPATRAASEQGIENLKILQFLSEQGFFELDVEPIPEEMDVSILPGSGATDLGILSTVEQEADGILVSRDQRLRDLSALKNLAVLDPRTLHEGGERYEGWLWDGINEQLKQGPTIHKDLIASLIPKLRTIDDLEGNNIGKSRVVYKAEAEQWLTRWRKRLTRYPESGGVMVAESESFRIVPTFDLLSTFSWHLTQARGKHYLKSAFLKKIHRFTELATYQRPFPIFYIPEAYIYQALENSDSEPHSEDVLKTLYALKQVSNALYHPITVKNHDTHKSLKRITIQAAKDLGCLLLCTKENEGIYQLGKLLQLNVKRLPEKPSLI